MARPEWSGKSTVEGYYRDDELHREDGPAQIERESDGSIVLEDYFLHGWRVPEAEVKTMSTPAKEAEGLKPQSSSDEPQHKKPRGRRR
jgi:hypothetical protein